MHDKTDSIFAVIAQNTGILIIGQCLDKAIHFVIFLVLWRYLGDAKTVFGQYGFVSSYVALFGAFAGLGFSVLCIREMARRPERSPVILTAALVPIIMSSVLVVAVIVFSVYFTKPGQSTLAIAALVMGVDLALNQIASVFEAIPRSRERMFYSVFPSLLRSSILLILYLVFLPKGLSLVQICLAIMFANVVRCAFQILIGRYIFHVIPSGVFDRSLSRELFLASYPMALTSFFIIIYYKIDSVMLSYMKGDASVALYTVASTLAFALLFIASNFQQALYPALTKLFVGSKMLMRDVYKMSFKYLAMIGFPIASGLAILAPRIIMLWRPDYIEAAMSLRILTAALFLMFLNGLMGYAMITADRQSAFMKIVGGGACLNIVLNLIVIPRYGIVGAACTTVCSEMFAALCCGFLLSSKYGLSGSLSDFLKMSVSCVIMCAAAIGCSRMPLFVVVAVSAVVYVFVLTALGTLGKDELALFKLLRRREN